MKKKLNILILTCLFVSGIFAQNQLVDFPTPNAANLGRFGQVPVSYFNGLPDISIPIYTIKLREIEIPISLRYSSGGIKPDDHPGWTGTGWTLNTGGAITRIINGRRDETTKQNILDETGTGFTDDKFGYYYTCPDYDVATWSSEGFLTKYVTHTLSSMYYKDTQPDEFIFNVAGMNGSFYFCMENGVRKVKIKSKENYNLKVEEAFSEENSKIADGLPHISQPTAFNPGKFNVKKTFRRFILTDRKGIKYIFGGNANSIDFTSTRARAISAPSAYLTNTIPTSWNLTSIITPGKDTIKYEYKKEGNVLINRKQKFHYAAYLKNNSNANIIYTNNSNDDNLLIQHPAYLKRIVASNGDDIQFSTSTSNELKYIWSSVTFQDFKIAVFLDDRVDILNTNYWLKLDSIAIGNLKKVSIIYNNAENQRLRMSEVKLSDPSGLASIQSYKFKYNSNYLPAYNSKQTDHWGYYNGKNYVDIHYMELNSYRIPDSNLMKAETLEKIYYPTGGVSIFEYEPHTYSKVALQYDPVTPFSIKNESGTASGLRIKKVITQEKEDSTAGQIIKECLYQNPNGSSSGVLSGKPIYYAEGKNHVKYCIEERLGLTYFKASVDYTQYYAEGSEQLLNPLSNTNGSHITYSRVIEKYSDGSSSTYNYTNHDQFMDQPPVSVYTNFDSKTINEPFISRELERGLLISTAHRNNQNVLVDSTYYEYNKTPNRYNNYVKSIAQKRLPGIAALEFTRFSALKIYTFYPYLEKMTHYSYGSNGSNIPIVESTSYLYNSYNLVSESSVKNSDGNTISEKFKYPSDFSTTVPYDSMVIKNILSPVVEKSEYKGTTFLSKEVNNYAKWHSLFYAPANQQVQTGSNPIETRMTYSYDSKGNVREIIKDGVDKVTYLWGYNYQYPIAEIKGASYEDVKAKISGTETTINSLAISLTPDMTKVDALRTSMPNAMITTYTYSPLVGMTTATDPRGVKTTYAYDTFGRLQNIKDNSSKIVNSFDYNYKK